MFLENPVQMLVQMAVMKLLSSLYSLQALQLLEKLTPPLHALRPTTGTMVKVHLFAQNLDAVVEIV